MTGRSYGLLGSGEFEPWSTQVDRWLLDRADGDGRVLILPTASAAEGDQVFDGWATKGMEHFAGTGIPAEIIPLKTHEDAERPEFAKAAETASMVYFSGGNPAYLSSVLRDTLFWEAVRRGLDRGMAFAGCSAGVACLGETAPDSAAMEPSEIFGHDGLRLFAGSDFGPHWDALDRFVPGLRQLILDAIPPGRRFLGIDENTAIVGDGSEWSVVGSGSVHLIEDGRTESFGPGASFVAPLDGTS